MPWPSRVISFGDFRFDSAEHRLWRGSEEIVLRPKASALLDHLLRHSGELVTKQQLLGAVWSDTSVSDAVLKVSISEIRRALGDVGHPSRLIETRYGRGYRMTAVIDTSDRQPIHRESSAPVVARQATLDTLRHHLARALGGARQTVFVTGEPGIGKTTVVEAFASEARAANEVWVACGHAVRYYGPGGPFEPVLEALNQLGRQVGHEALAPLFAAHGPTWLAHLGWSSGITAPADSESGRGRMLREMTEAIAVLTASKPLVVILEDLHWADSSTLDLVAFLARPTEPARLLIVGTAQPFDSLVASHPLRTIKQELQIHRRCTELALPPFQVADVGAYLEARLSDRGWPDALAEGIHRQTEGNPLYVAGLIDDLVRRGLLPAGVAGLPISSTVEQALAEAPGVVRELTLMNLETLESADRRVLEAASVVGREFSAADVAAVLGENALSIEERCERLARRQQYLESAGSVRRPDGRVTARFRFLHAFARQVLCQELLPRLRSRFQLHARQNSAHGPELKTRHRSRPAAKSRDSRVRRKPR